MMSNNNYYYDLTGHGKGGKGWGKGGSKLLIL